MKFTLPFNPFTQWMNWKDVYVTYDELEVYKKSNGDDPIRIGTFGKDGNLSWPLFMQMLSGMMQYSAVETGFSDPLLRPQDYQKLADHLEAQDGNSFVLKSKNLKVGFKSMDEAVKTSQDMRSMSTSVAKMWWPMLSDQLDQTRDAFDNAQEVWKESVRPVFPADEMDLGEVARNTASWLKAAQAMQPFSSDKTR